MKMNVLMILAGVVLIVAGVVRIMSEPVAKPEAAAEPEPGYAEPVEPAAPQPIAETRMVEPHPEPEAPIAAGAFETPKAEPKAVGNAFEDYVANLFKDRSRFSVLEWNQGQTSSEGVYAKADENPDFKISQKLGKDFDLIYWVECKYRSHFRDDNILIKEYQLKRYRRIQRESRRKVLLAIGIGNEPGNPRTFYLIPLDSIAGEQISAETLAPFEMTEPQTQLAPWMRDYFLRKVFKKQ